MSWDKLNKDIIHIILNKLGERDFPKLLLLNKRTYKFYDEILFMNRMKLKYYEDYLSKSENYSWKDWYMQEIRDVVTYLDDEYDYLYDDEDFYITRDILSQQRKLNIEEKIGQASSAGLVSLTHFFIRNMPEDEEYRQDIIDQVLINGVKYDNMKIVELALESGGDDSAGIYWSFDSKNEKYIKFFVETGTFDVEEGLRCAMEHNNKKWINYFLNLTYQYEKTNKLWEAALHSGDSDLIERFMPNDPKFDIINLYNVSYGSNLKWILEFLKRGHDPFPVFSSVDHVEVLPELERITGYTPDWNEVLRKAAMCGRDKLCKYAVEKGADDFTEAIRLALGNQCWEVIEYIISLNKKVDKKIIFYHIDLNRNTQRTDYINLRNYDKYCAYFLLL